MGGSLVTGMLGLAPALAGHGFGVALGSSVPGWGGEDMARCVSPLSWPQGLEGKWGFT